MEKAKKVFKRVMWLIGLHLVLFALIYDGANRYYDYKYVGTVIKTSVIPGYRYNGKWRPAIPTCWAKMNDGTVYRLDIDAHVGQIVNR